ncbi:hypothetical protein FRC01_009256, partial [Tulasnella sp. 417]
PSDIPTEDRQRRPNAHLRRQSTIPKARSGTLSMVDQLSKLDEPERRRASTSSDQPKPTCLQLAPSFLMYYAATSTPIRRRRAPPVPFVYFQSDRKTNLHIRRCHID